MWFLLNYVPPRGLRRDGLPALVNAYDPGLELFAPTFISLISEKGNVRQSEKPLLYHYIFLRGSEELIKRFCLANHGFSFVMDRTAPGAHVSLSDEALEQFRIIARYYSGQLPCYPLEGINLEEGDRVQIVSGPCAGLTGTYISRKGGRSGNVLVAVDSATAAIVYDVKAEYVRVLEFARDSKRVYDQLDAFAARLQPLLSSVNHPSGLPKPSLREIAAANVFTTRLGEVKIHNPKLDAKLRILLFAAYSLLADTARAEEALARYEALANHITNPKTRSLAEAILHSFAL